MSDVEVEDISLRIGKKLRPATVEDMADYCLALSKAGKNFSWPSSSDFSEKNSNTYRPKKADALAMVVEDSRHEFFVALEDCKIPGLYGANSISIIAPKGITVKTSGHNEVFSMDDPKVPVGLYPDVALEMGKRGHEHDRSETNCLDTYWLKFLSSTVDSGEIGFSQFRELSEDGFREFVVKLNLVHRKNDLEDASKILDMDIDKIKFPVKWVKDIPCDMMRVINGKYYAVDEGIACVEGISYESSMEVTKEMLSTKWHIFLPTRNEIVELNKQNEIERNAVKDGYHNLLDEGPAC